jgi:hypothetical protein
VALAAASLLPVADGVAEATRLVTVESIKQTVNSSELPKLKIMETVDLSAVMPTMAVQAFAELGSNLPRQRL